VKCTIGISSVRVHGSQGKFSSGSLWTGAVTETTGFPGMGSRFELLHSLDSSFAHVLRSRFEARPEFRTDLTKAHCGSACQR